MKTLTLIVLSITIANGTMTPSTDVEPLAIHTVTGSAGIIG